MGATIIKLPQSVEDDLAALQRRSVTFAKRGRTLTLLALSATASAAAAYALSHWLSPSVTLTAVHMPDELLRLFAANAQSVVAGSPFESPLGSMTEMLSGPVPKLAVGLAIVAGGLAAVLRGSMKLAIAPVLLVGPVFIVPMLLNASGQSEEGGESDRESVVRLARVADHAGLERMLAKADAAEPIRTYVLAQARLAAEGAMPKLPPAVTAELASKVKALDESIARGLPASLSEKSLYAVESAFLGRPESAPARAYFEGGSRNSGFAAMVGRVFAGLAVLTWLLGGGAATLGAVLRARLARIRPLLGIQTSGASASDRQVESAQLPATAHPVESSSVGLD